MDFHSHVFLKYDYTTKFWNKVDEKLEMDYGDLEWNDTVNEFAQRFNGNLIGSIIRRLCLAASVYLIWMRLMSLKARNTTTVRKAQLLWELELKLISKNVVVSVGNK
ncbi:hypothetical protein Tco_0943560 [Tanacetum coccineum]